jgi:hypothetical protein
MTDWLPTAVVLCAIVIQTIWLTYKITAVRAQVQALRRDDTEPAWQWPPRPINGHDHPEPEELVPEERA